MVKILWVDDEVELLKPHVLFLQQKGYEVDTCNNGYDAIDMASEGAYDLIILDEMMPGMTGLETLPKIKEVRPTTPVIMVTKSEEENIMDKAVGSKIADYLIKPVNPNQVLLSIKKNVHQQQLVTEQTTADYRSEFGRISSSLQMADTFQDWCALYRKLTAWEVELAESTDQSIKEVLTYQKSEANQEFCKFVRRNYYNWINKRSDDTPVMSHTLMRTNIFPVVDENPKTTLLLIDNFRYDQWRSISSLLRGWYDVAQDDFYCAILPTATQYARNAVFAGLMPLAIDRLMPNKWLNDNEEGGKNQYEEEFLKRLMSQNGKNWKFSFDKLVRPEQGRKLVDNIQKVYDADFSVIVYNFLDILSHARTETDIIRELTEDDAAFRSLTRSWFEHGPLHHPQAPLRAGTHRRHHLGPRHDPRGQPGEGDRRPRDLGQPALQDGPQPRVQLPRSLRNPETRGRAAAVEQPHVELHLRLQHRFPRLQQRREPPHPLLPQHVPARRHFDGGDDRTVYRSKAKTIDENHSHHLAGRASAGRRGDHRLAGPPYGGRLPRRDGRGQNHAHP